MRDVRRPLPNWDADADLSTAEPGISETVSNLISLSSSPDSPDSDDSFFFGRHFITAAEMAQMTQNMVDTLRQASEDNTTALVTSMRNLAAQRKLEGIPTFSEDSNCPLVIDEWFKIAERVARLADWTDPLKLSYFQEKLTKSAANFNDSLTDAQRQTYAVWKPFVLQGLSDDTIKAVKKCELKELQQDPTEQVCDFQKRIDDMYKLAYREGPVTSNDANVI